MYRRGHVWFGHVRACAGRVQAFMGTIMGIARAVTRVCRHCYGHVRALLRARASRRAYGRLRALLWACAGVYGRCCGHVRELSREYEGAICGRVQALLRGGVVGLVAGACGHYYGRVRASTGAVMGICKIPCAPMQAMLLSCRKKPMYSIGKPRSPPAPAARPLPVFSVVLCVHCNHWVHRLAMGGSTPTLSPPPSTGGAVSGLHPLRSSSAISFATLN